MRIGLIAGNGQFPIIFSKAAKAKGFAVYAVAHNNETDPGLKDHVDGIEWIYIGQIKRIIKFFKKNHISQTVLIGGITKTRMFSDVWPDTKAISIIAGMRHTHDDGLLRRFARVLEKEGVEVKASTFLLPDLLAQPGCWTKRKPLRSEKKDIELGWKLAKEVGRLDIGQCVVVGGGSVLAVEAIDGTDATIRRGGRLGENTAVVVKVCKPSQDVRFDIPAVGAQTIRTMHEVGVAVLVVEAAKAVVFDREEMINLADEFGIAIVAMEK
ncbi:MAG: UDP-2,3-diacylglucosamine diphosphatase LpxI [Deltaproteobacteria bacterium]|nr:UDP-2,3-diacylglucosamine diphosphatase LpxI [Deltaproteobacteria bacterium]